MAGQDPYAPRGAWEEGAPLISPTLSESPFAPPLVPKKKKPWIVLIGVIYLLVAIIDVGAYLAEAPKTRVFEANLCIRYYETHDPSKIGPDGTVAEHLCKEDEIQQKLAMIFGWQDMFDAIPGILLAVPFGLLADRVGRKWVFAASLMGLQFQLAWVLLISYFRSLPLQLTWLSSVFLAMGGGPMVATAIGMTMVSDIVPPEKRTSVFLYLTASVLVAELLAPILAARLMEKGDYIPLLLALAIQQLGIFLAMLFPETLHMRDLPEPKDADDESIELQTKHHGYGFQAQMYHLKDAFAFLRSDYTLGLVVLTFLGNRLGRQSITLLIRYASKRYGWEIKKAAYLTSFRAATNLVALTVFVPLVNIILLKRLRIAAHWADLWIARVSIALTTVSFLIMGVSAYPALLILGLLIYNLGTGYNAAMRSTSIHVVGGQSSPNIGRLMSLIAIVESIGSMFGGPLINAMFQMGIERGGMWLGLPFFGAALVFAGMTFATASISVRDKDVLYSGLDTEDTMEPDSPLANSPTWGREGPLRYST
ncbi:major facilitator superfamily domain-containing protein [Massariosphaeria phaeospora]|uniref:Major facilitator superfamily domain-containing protein n=1 Tax=Massariosphaeria phaeospora TaxID=100035 RepID=A0A7C8IA83_9PLEO|nr:major facilitator superfamily domain-containing protein [Massariosphaeria phaeospora]